MSARHSLAYLATPFMLYRRGLEQAAADATAIAWKLIRSGLLVYSPIAYTFHIAKSTGLNHLDMTIWMPLEERMCAACDVLIVAKLEGWFESLGIRREVIRFEQARKPIYEYDPVTQSMLRRRYAVAEDVSA